jgi:hypothetical protein
MNTKWLILAVLVLPSFAMAGLIDGIQHLKILNNSKVNGPYQDPKPTPNTSPPPKKKAMQIAVDQQQQITAERKAQMERKTSTSGSADITGTSIGVQKQLGRKKQENQKLNRTEQKSAQQATPSGQALRKPIPRGMPQ